MMPGQTLSEKQRFTPVLRNLWAKLFIVVSALHLIAILADMPMIVFATKPLLLLNLMGLYINQSTGFGEDINYKIVGALFFSFLGDVLLMFQSQKQVFFMLGLAAFLTAHIFYILYFIQLMKKQGTRRWKFPVVIGVTMYAVAMFSILAPSLGMLKIPVTVYTVVISLMLITAAHAMRPGSFAGALIVFGALLFVISDSVLAFNKFYSPFAFASFAIMITYILAQGCLVAGALCLHKKGLSEIRK